MPESENHLLSSEDINNFMMRPEEEIDSFAIMAGSIVGNYNAFNTLSIVTQELLFTHLHTYAFYAFETYDRKWNAALGEFGDWNEARALLDSIIDTNFPETGVSHIAETIEDTKMRKNFRAKIQQAHSTLLDMLRHGTPTCEDLANLKAYTTQKRRTYGSQTIAPGKTHNSRGIYSRR